MYSLTEIKCKNSLHLFIFLMCNNSAINWYFCLSIMLLLFEFISLNFLGYMRVTFLCQLMQPSCFLMLVCRTAFLDYLFTRRQYLSSSQWRVSTFLVHCKSKSVITWTSLWLLRQIVSMEEDSEQTPTAWVWKGTTSAVSVLSSQDQAELGPSAAHEIT